MAGSGPAGGTGKWVFSNDSPRRAGRPSEMVAHWAPASLKGKGQADDRPTWRPGDLLKIAFDGMERLTGAGWRNVCAWAMREMGILFKHL